MFHSDENFGGLDELFHIDKPGHLWSRDELKKRVNELNGIYQGSSYNIWLFSQNNEERNRIQDYAYTAMETLRYASLCHIMGFFQASIILSSMATERLLHCVLLLSGAIQREPLPEGTVIVPVRSVTGTADYAVIPRVGWEPVAHPAGSHKAVISLGVMLTLSRVFDLPLILDEARDGFDYVTLRNTFQYVDILCKDAGLLRYASSATGRWTSRKTLIRLVS